VLITHYGCAWYGQRLRQTPEQCMPGQVEDVQAAAMVLHDWYPALRVEAYLAMRQQAWLSFHQLDIGDAVGPRRSAKD
jgi:hypothetical protein